MPLKSDYYFLLIHGSFTSTIFYDYSTELPSFVVPPYWSTLEIINSSETGYIDEVPSMNFSKNDCESLE
jgi:hypothetical protein